MRITNNMMINTLKRDLFNNMWGMAKWERQLSTGRKINLPSDDPAGLVRSLRLRTSITQGEQYISNIGDAINFMETTDSAFNNINQIMLRVRELTVKAANETNDQSAEQAVAAEIRELNGQLKMIANTTYGTKYIFGGRNVTEAPSQGDKWLGNDEDLELEIGTDVKIPINLKTKDFFIGTEPYQKDIQITDTNIIKQLNAQNLQGGSYDIDTSVLTADTDAGLTPADHYVKQGGDSIFGGTSALDGTNTVENQNASIELTVAGINGNNVIYSYVAHEYNVDGTYSRHTGEFTLDSTDGATAVEIETGGSDPLVLSLQAPADTSTLTVGDREVLNVTAAVDAGDSQVTINCGGNAACTFNFKAGALDNKTIDLKFFSEDDLGQSFDSTINLQVGTMGDADPAVTFTTKKGLFALMDELATDIENMDTDAIQAKLGDIDDKLDDLLLRRSTIGAKVNRLELQQNRLESTQTSYAGLLGQVEDADIAEVIMNLKMQENVYKASLAAGARIIQPTLVDFLS